MLYLSLLHQMSGLSKTLENQLVCILHVNPFVVRNFIGELSIFINRTNQASILLNDVICKASLIIDLNMNHTNKLCKQKELTSPKYGA